MTPQNERMLQVARQYCDLIEEVMDAGPLSEWLESVAVLLPRINAAVVQLPQDDVSPDFGLLPDMDRRFELFSRLRELLGELDRSEFYVPGSILRLELEPGHWLAAGVPTRTIAWFEDGLAFEAEAADAGVVEIVGRYGEEETLLSGWITGEEHVAGHGALAIVQHGRGRVVLFGFKPQYRGQTIATYPLVFNAVKRALESTGAGSRDDSAGSDR